MTPCDQRSLFQRAGPMMYANGWERCTGAFVRVLCRWWSCGVDVNPSSSRKVTCGSSRQLISAWVVEDGMPEGQKNEVTSKKRRERERERQKEGEQLWFTPGDCWRLRLLGLFVMCVGRKRACTWSAKFVAESCRVWLLSRRVCDSFLSSHGCSEKGGVQSCFVAVSWTQAKFVSGDTSETKREREREREMRDGGMREGEQACWKKAAVTKRSTFMLFKVEGIKRPSCLKIAEANVSQS